MRGRSPRCDGCRMVLAECACEALSPLDFRTELVLVPHPRELDKPTNTGLWAAAIMRGARVVPRADPDLLRVALDAIGRGRRPMLLFPREDARVLTVDDAFDPRPVTLIVPDGNWRQAKKAASREAGLLDVPRVRLPLDLIPRARLRQHPHSDHVSTFEAIAEAIGILEGEAPKARLLTRYDRLVKATWAARGRGKLPQAGPSRLTSPDA